MTDVPRETFRRYVDMLLAENQVQNLVSRASERDVWSRHIEDSLQLAELAPDAVNWLDIGSGAGLPGIPIAIATAKPVVLAEPRARRVDFLRRVVTELGLGHVDVAPTTLERMPPRPFAAITARAVAPLGRLFEMSLPFSTSETVWILPKGQSAQTELETARRDWQGEFRIVPSRTDPMAGIILARQVRRRGQ